MRKDIYDGDAPSWRWTNREPTLKLLLTTTKDLRFSSDFAIWNDGFLVTGPLEISFLVNGRPLDTVRYTTSGAKHFEKPVSPNWLSIDSETLIAMSVDKLYVAPRDGTHFGVILVRMGFIQ
jgi:hypothetical protein